MRFLKKKQIPPIWILGVASGLSSFGMTIVIPALNSIAEHFGATYAGTQFVVSAYLFGLAITQPICGFLCDRYGRRPVMLTGFALFSLTSLLCMLANSLEQLILARFFQAVGVSVGTVASRSILRDVYDREKMAEAMSYIAIAMGIAPIIAPAFGGLIDASMSFLWTFLATSVIGLLIFIKMYFGLSETLPEDMEKPEVRKWLSNYAVLLSSGTFIGNTLIFGFVQGGFFSFVAVGSLLFLTEFNIGSAEFGVLWGAMAFSYVVGALVSAQLTPVIGTTRVMRWSIGLSIVAGILIVICASVGELTVLKVLLPLGLLMTLSGGASPGSLAGAVVDHPTRAGSASGLSSSIGLVTAGIFSVIAGSIYDGSYPIIALIICLCTVASGLSWLLVRAGQRAQPVQIQ